MEVNDIITVIGTFFSIAVAIKTLFFNDKKGCDNSVQINGNRNNAKIVNVNKRTNIINNTNKYVVPQKINNKSNRSVSVEEEIFKFGGLGLCFIVSIVIVLVFNIYIVSILSVLVTISLFVNIRRTRKYQLTSEEIIFIVLEHVILSVIVISMLYIPNPIHNLLDQIQPINVSGLSLLIEWLMESGTLVWHSLQGSEFLNVGVVVLLRLVATILLAYIVLNQFLKKIFMGKMNKFTENKRKLYTSHIIFYICIILLLHSSLIYYPMKEVFSPLFESGSESIRNWLNK